MIQKIICIVLPILIGLFAKLFIDHMRGKYMKDCNDLLIKYLSNDNGKLYKSIMSIINSIGSEMTGKELLFFDIFLETIKNDALNEFNSRIEDIKNLPSIFGLPKISEKQKKFIDDIRYKVCIQEAITLIFNKDQFHDTIAKIYMNNVSKNIDHLKALEKEYIDYSSTFGKEPDGDPILHPYESKNDADTEEDLEEKSFEDLLGIGTAEDIEEDYSDESL